MKIKVSFFGVLMIICQIFTHSYIALAALLAAFLHELGHIIAAVACKIELREMKLDVFGAAITPQGAICSYKKEMIFAAAGPLVNIISVVVLMPLWNGAGEFLRLFIAASCFLGAINILPICDLDGGRIMQSALSLFLSPNMVNILCGMMSFLCAFSLWLLSVYLILRISATLSLFVFSFAVLCKMCVGSKSVV